VVLIVTVFVALSTATAQDKSFSIEPPTLLSDTHGYDFGSYIRALMNRVRNNWYMMIPDVARRGTRRGEYSSFSQSYGTGGFRICVW
jgi:hypothetical protein